METRVTAGAKRAVLLVAAGILVFGLILSSCSKPASGAPGASSKAGAAAQATAKDTVFPVAVAPAVLGDLNDYVSLAGGIEPSTQVDVYSDASGQLVTLNVRLGQYVAQNEVVAEVDPSRPGQNYVPSPVRAPIAGTVTSLPVDVGSRITQGIPVVQISTINQLQIRTQVAERYVGAMRVGEPAVIALEPFPNESFAARIVELAPVIDPQTRTMDVTLKFNTVDARAKAGMFAEIKIITLHKRDIVKIPADAVVVRGERSFVFVEGAAGTAEQRDVKIGISVDGKSEVLSGLAAGDRVVVRGQTLLENGSKVKVVEELRGLAAVDSVL